jgi:succinate dehydrogenase / fumarate reductase cytochrome b subunit
MAVNAGGVEQEDHATQETQATPMATNSTAAHRKRPVNLNLLQLTLQLPVGGVVSIIHRATGALLVLLIPYALYALQTSLQSPMRFEQIRASLASGFGRVALLLALWVLVQHLYSGIRHLFMDVDVGIELAAARRAAWLTLAASIVTVALLGVLL